MGQTLNVKGPYGKEDLSMQENVYKKGSTVDMLGTARTAPEIRLGLLANWQQFTLLVLVNAFVGGMVGLERTVVPLIGEQEFGLASKTAIVSFIVSFGITKALCNLFAARLSETWGRKKVLVFGWLIGLPVPFIIIWANHWWWFPDTTTQFPQVLLLPLCIPGPRLCKRSSF